MQWLLLFFCLLFSGVSNAQRGLLFVKKRGYKKVASYAEGQPIRFRTKDHQFIYGPIALIRNDSLRVNGAWFRSGDITQVILRPKGEGGAGAPFLLTTAGVALSTAGMTMAGWGSFSESLAYSSVIGYGNYLVRLLPKAKRKKYRIGRKFSLHTLDLRF